MYLSASVWKFNTVSNDHGRTQKCDFCVSVCKVYFTDHHVPNTIHGFRDSFPVCKMHNCMTCKNFEHFHSFPSTQAMQAITRSRLDENKPLQNPFKVFSATYTHSNCIVYQLLYCWKLEWIYEGFILKSSGKYKRREEGECTLHHYPKSW